jgi:hypothetical protein
MSDALPILKQAAWATIAQFVLSGKDEYGKYLDGLDRLPTTAEVKAIPAPTS